MRSALRLRQDGKAIVLNIISGRTEEGMCWVIVENKKGDGQWYSIDWTRELSDIMLTRLYDALIRRRYMHGFNATILRLCITRREGICFHWKKGEAGKIDEAALPRIQERYERKNMQQRVYRGKSRCQQCGKMYSFVSDGKCSFCLLGVEDKREERAK